MRRAIADHFKEKVFYGGLTYNSHPLACAAALASIQVYEEDKLIDNARKMGGVIRQLPAPLAPFNGTSEEMAALGKFFRQEGLYTFVRWNTFFTNPPLCITEAELREAFAIIDRGLDITDKAVR